MVRLTSSSELTPIEPAIPLIAITFSGRICPDNEVATWSVIIDHDQARDVANILNGALSGLDPSAI